MAMANRSVLKCFQIVFRAWLLLLEIKTSFSGHYVFTYCCMWTDKFPACIVPSFKERNRQKRCSGIFRRETAQKSSCMYTAWHLEFIWLLNLFTTLSWWALYTLTWPTCSCDYLSWNCVCHNHPHDLFIFLTETHSASWD